MKEKSSLTKVCLLVIVTFSISSCKKIIDEIVKHPSKGVVDDCRIEKIIARSYYEYTNAQGQLVPYYDTAYFSYNNMGNPTTVKHSLYKAFPAALVDYAPNDRIYKYDNKNRLKSYLLGYTRVLNEGVDKTRQWHVFDYNGRQITKHIYYEGSAAYSSGNDYQSIKDVPTDYVEVDKIIYSTDEYGRIIRADYDSFSQYFNYDASGNLIGDGYTYSNNYSYLQTNKIWMFLAQNYSVNAKTAPLLWYEDDYPVEFNSRKLPTKFDQFYPDIFDSRAEPIATDPVMIYKCK